MASIDLHSEDGRTSSQLLGCFGSDRQLTLSATVVLPLSLIAGAVRWFGLLEPSFWFDEAMSWRTSTLPWDAMIRSLSRNTHPPLYFAVLKLWIGVLGESVLALRSLNVVIAMLTAPIMWLFCSEAAAQQVGRNKSAQFRQEANAAPLPELRKALVRPTYTAVAACLLVACSPFQIRLAWEARMYPLLVFLTVLSSWLLMRVIRNPATIMRWVYFGIASLAMLYTHYFAMFIVAGQWLFLVWWAGRNFRSLRRLWKFRDWWAPPTQRTLLGCSLAAIIIAGGSMLWVPTFLRQRQRVADGWWTEPLNLTKALESAADWVASARVLGVGATSMTCAAAVVLVVVALWRQDSVVGKYIATVVGCGTGVPLLCSIVGTNIVVSRYFAAVQVLWLIGLAVLLANMKNAIVRWSLLLTIIVFFAAAHTSHVQSLDLWARPGIQAAVGNIESQLRDDDQILANSPLVYLPAQFHFRNRDQLRLLEEDAGTAFFTGGPVLRLSERLAFGAIPSDRRRLWLISREASAGVPSSQWQFVSCQYFPGTAPFQEQTSVTLYERQ